MPSSKILLGHGSGGKLMHQLIKETFLKKLDNPILRELMDSALIDYEERIAFTTDSFVVSPLFFPGADIGKLSVCGTVNDLVMVGAIPEYLSVALIAEEGLDLEVLERVTDSLMLEAKRCKVKVAAGDFKVVEKGACDQLFINTSGIGRVLSSRRLSLRNLKVKDRVIITGNLAEHGLAVLAKRKELALGFNLQSDCAALNDLLIPLLKKIPEIKFMRDPTRGGLATTLNEITAGSNLGIILEEKSIPVSGKVRAACELLGIDPLYVANEGKAVLIVAESAAKQVLGLLKKHPLGKQAQEIGSVVREPKGRVLLNTAIGTQRIVDMLTSEPLPRIC